MTFPITLKSIKMLLAAEILSLLSEAFTLIVTGFSIAAFTLEISIEDFSNPQLVLMFFIMLLLLAARVSCYILYLIGMRRASAEDDNFKVAFYATVISLVLAVPSSVFTLNKEIASIVELLLTLTVLLTEVYVLEGIRSLSKRLGHPEMDKRGGLIYLFITTIFVIQTCVSVFILVLGGATASAAASWLGVAASFLSVAESLVFVFYFMSAIRIFSKE